MRCSRRRPLCCSRRVGVAIEVTLGLKKSSAQGGEKVSFPLEERGERLGESVGYHVRLDARLPSTPASVVFCTTGILLRQLSGSRGLDGVVHVVVDEVCKWKDIFCVQRNAICLCVSVTCTRI